MKRVLWIVVLAGCSPKAVPPASSPGSAVEPRHQNTFVTAKNYTYTDDSARMPQIRALNLPAIPGGAAIWGATGRDRDDTLYFGVSCESRDGAAAHLLTYKPATGEFTDLGGEANQNKIHTKLLQADNGFVYYASMDEAGENEDGSRLPTHGSTLWCYLPEENSRGRLGHVREAIIAVAAGGPYVYFLGYFNHVLYQYDTAKSKIKNQVVVGSVGGHTTRNFFADDRGHVFVPRVTAAKAELVEFDDELKEVKAFPLDGYSLTPDSSSHGLVGVTPLKDGGWLFTTDRGKLYRVDPRATGSTLTDLGWIHPQGECYAACLFSFDGENHAVAIGNRVKRGEPVYEWIRFDLKAKTSTAEPLNLPVPGGATNVLVYGSYTRDDAGRCYVGGTCKLGDTNVPVLWCLEP